MFIRLGLSHGNRTTVCSSSIAQELTDSAQRWDWNLKFKTHVSWRQYKATSKLSTCGDSCSTYIENVIEEVGVGLELLRCCVCCRRTSISSIILWLRLGSCHNLFFLFIGVVGKPVVNSYLKARKQRKVEVLTSKSYRKGSFLCFYVRNVLYYDSTVSQFRCTKYLGSFLICVLRWNDGFMQDNCAWANLLLNTVHLTTLGSWMGSTSECCCSIWEETKVEELRVVEIILRLWGIVVGVVLLWRWWWWWWCVVLLLWCFKSLLNMNHLWGDL